ncbi:hypothetical protein EVAR_30624_1 [Eumeta japonica]|uniref:RNase H type-1 domain-containing protein n=1 Tax=Eumeta variegata TaxID=151549 RepID=A0A4C1WBK5_EUMVA|nr:hypothetical protein EVAR_30624_1 [Eumeta japonica]
MRRLRYGKVGLVNIFSDFRSSLEVRALAGIAGNERADEFSRRAALTKKTTVDYDRFPLSHAKKADQNDVPSGSDPKRPWRVHVVPVQVQAAGLTTLRL